MRKFSTKELYEFAYRADTQEKIAIAERWLKEHREILSAVEAEMTLRILGENRKRIFIMQLAELEEKLRKNA